MAEYLTQKVRLVQTDRKRIWRTLDNELFLDDDGYIYIVPRYMCTDNYTIPMWVAWIAGSPVDYRVEPSHIHDLACYSLAVVYTTLTKEELIEKGYYRYSEKLKLWVCEDIPKEYLAIRTMTKAQANNLLGRAMRAAKVPFRQRVITRLGVCFNFGWYVNQWKGKVVPIDLDRFYDPTFWDFVGE